MSVLFGPVVQQAYVVPDIMDSTQHWLARGVGPFFLMHLDGSGVHGGEEMRVHLSAAFAFSGEQQIELIQIHNKEPTVYRQFIDANPRGGLHHLGFWVESIDDKLHDLEAAGHDYRVLTRYGDMEIYLDSVDHPGVIIQLMALRNVDLQGLFGLVRRGADTWDGVNEPIRLLDWSSGRPTSPTRP